MENPPARTPPDVAEDMTGWKSFSLDKAAPLTHLFVRTLFQSIVLESIMPLSRRQNCESCGSANIHRENLAQPGPSLVYTLLFGWFFLLLRLAFIPRSGICRDCGKSYRYRTAGSYVAMILVTLLVLLAVLGLLFSLSEAGLVGTDY
jgi:hypothetical protein